MQHGSFGLSRFQTRALHTVYNKLRSHAEILSWWAFDVTFPGSNPLRSNRSGLNVSNGGSWNPKFTLKVNSFRIKINGQNFASQVLSRQTFKISREKGSDFFDHRGTLRHFPFYKNGKQIRYHRHTASITVKGTCALKPTSASSKLRWIYNDNNRLKENRAFGTKPSVNIDVKALCFPNNDGMTVEVSYNWNYLLPLSTHKWARSFFLCLPKWSSGLWPCTSCNAAGHVSRKTYHSSSELH